MNKALRQQVWDRAGGACEYCRVPQELDRLPFQVDHIVAQKHHGPTAADNLALSCYSCNAYKGPNIAGIDPKTGSTTTLFHPRQHTWNEHFKWNGPELLGRTPVGRTTLDVLKMNLSERIEYRRLLHSAGLLKLEGD